MFFKDYSLLVVFYAYLKCKCRYIHVRWCRIGSDSFTQDSARLVERKKERKKKKDEQFAWAAIQSTTLETSASFAKGILCSEQSSDQSYVSGFSRNAKTAKICNGLPESRHLDFRRQASSPGDIYRLPTSARTSDSLRDSENAVEMYNSRDYVRKLIFTRE